MPIEQKPDPDLNRRAGNCKRFHLAKQSTIAGNRSLASL